MTLLAERDILCAGPFCNQLKNGGADAPAVIGSQILGFMVNTMLILGGVLLLIFLLSGAIDWITSAGDKEKVTKAREKITHALIGIVILSLVFSLWLVIVVDILGIFGAGGSFQLPVFGR